METKPEKIPGMDVIREGNVWDMPYQWVDKGPRGARFIIYPNSLHSDENVKEAINILQKNNHFPVEIKRVDLKEGIFCPHCLTGVLEVIKGTEPYDTDHLMCSYEGCQSTYQNGIMNSKIKYEQKAKIMKKRNLQRGKSAIDQESRIKEFLKWIHPILKNPARYSHAMDKDGFVIFTRLSSHIKEEYGLAPYLVLFAISRLDLVETDYYNSPHPRVIRMKWKDNLDMTDDDMVSIAAQRLRAIIQAKRQSDTEKIPYADHLTTPITTVKIEPEEKIEQPILQPEIKDKPQPKLSPLGLKFAEDAAAAGYTVIISIPEIGTEIILNKKK